MFVIGLLFGITLGVLLALLSIAKYVGWTELIVEDEKRIFAKTEKTES